MRLKKIENAQVILAGFLNPVSQIILFYSNIYYTKIAIVLLGITVAVILRSHLKLKPISSKNIFFSYYLRVSYTLLLVVIAIVVAWTMINQHLKWTKILIAGSSFIF